MSRGRRPAPTPPVTCPGCRGRLLWKRYVRPSDEESVLPGLGRVSLGGLVPLDARPRPDDDTYASYAVAAGVPGARLITEAAPFDPATERRHTTHHATHPQCSDRLQGRTKRKTR